MEASTKEARAMAAEFRAMEKAEFANPSTKAREIVKAREKADTIASLREAAKDMGISARELATDILSERAMMETPAKETKEWEAGHSVIENKNRRSIVKARIYAEHATRPDYRIARELLDSIGREFGAVVTSLPNGEIAVFGTYRAIDPEYARALQEKAIAGVEKVAARIESAETAIEKAPLKKGTPEMKKELADAERAMMIARQRLVKANVRAENAKAISADGIRLQEKARFDSLDLEIAVSLNRLTPAIEAWELPSAIIRRPFREYVRPNIRRNPVSPVECEVLRNEADAEKAIVRALVKAEIEKVIAEKAEKENADSAAKRAETNAAYKMREAERKRNARAAKRNAR
jgi:hypothetical protein